MFETKVHKGYRALFVGGPWHGQVHEVEDGRLAWYVPLPAEMGWAGFPSDPMVGSVAYLRVPFEIEGKGRFVAYTVEGRMDGGELKDAILRAGVSALMDTINSAP